MGNQNTMKSRYYFLIAFLFLSFTAQAQFGAVKNALNQKPQQDQYVAFLTAKGYNPEVDKDGDVKFTYKDKTYYLTIDQKDPNFFRMARIANLRLSSEANINQAKQICHDITKDAKMTKVYWSNGQIWASSEQIVASAGDFEGIFDRTLELTQKAYQSFVKSWKNRDQ